ncbi:MAG: MFS transporter [Pseudomonadota bacterium]
MAGQLSNAEHIASRPFAVWTLGGLFAANAVGLDSPLVAVPEIATYFDVGQGGAQLIIVLFLAGYAAGHIPVGILGDRFGRRPVILIGLALAALLSLIAVFAPTFEVLLIARFLQGIATCAAGLLSRAVIRDIASGARASKLTSSAMMVLAVLIIVTPLLASYLLYVFDWRHVLMVTFLYVVILFWLTVIFIPETMHTERHSNHPWQQFRLSLDAFLKSAQSVRASLLGALAFATFFIFSAAGASLVVDVYKLPAASFGILFALMAFIQLAASAYNSRIVAKQGTAFVLKRAAVMSGIGIALSIGGFVSGYVPLTLFLLTAAAFTIAHALTLPNSIALTLDPLPKTAGFTSAIHGMLQTGIAAIAGVVVSLAYDATAETVLRIYSAFGLVTLIVLISGRRLFLSPAE